MIDLHGRHVLVTGASGRLGTAVCEALLAVGAHVLAAGRTRTRLSDLRASVGQHERLNVVEADVTDAPRLEALLEAAERRAPLDAAIHTVGAFRAGPLVDCSDEDLEILWQTNVHGAALLLRGLLRRMIPRRQGTVVVVASDAALRPSSPGAAFYGACKTAVLHLARSAAAEAAPAGVRVEVLCPGPLRTPENEAAGLAAHMRLVSTREAAAAAVSLLGGSMRASHGSVIVLPATESADPTGFR
ncbi:MAG: SDR family oxidoreductase [Myxococcota bacterium]|nr:SDR family oxidoreductase [Myxococcota bacterium]MDW8363953.1 SDR family oxidoreductase [Myxococcales bacterium]